ncbi:MAG: polyprenyl synthetase family protein [Clostridia bacterium]|nr:polyprenyl synthetase family protein [Clostridia bacterium]
MHSLKEYARMAENTLEDIFRESREEYAGAMYRIPPLLLDSMRYSVMAGGKRLRPAMLLATVEMLGGDFRSALIPAAALEIIHTYSLIHDDLPGMDNDTLRRGRPTNHVVYGVGQAILAGDGLLNHAFTLLLRNAQAQLEKNPSFDLPGYLRAMQIIAANAGAEGMIAGQTIDLACENGKMPSNAQMLEAMQLGKTSCMFIGAMQAGGCLAGASSLQMQALFDYARAFGLLFQAVDDLLDVESDPSVLGKSVGKDAASGKLTCIGQYGLEGTRQRAKELAEQGIAAMEIFDERAEFFRDLIREMVNRKA